MFSRVYDGHFQVNNHSFSTFANTISFNISRYPTPVEITDSKDYQGPGKPAQSSNKQNGVENGVKRTEEAEVAALVTTAGCGDTNIEYVPAEYFRGVDTHQVAQSGEISVCQSVAPSLSVYVQFQSRRRSPS